ncbi:MAG TPA: 1-(5-phosphoribosyl)-5-[(5-phosphoribosylamino)methylideneamino] imidazole-4-carboxamide isomerase [Gemmatimonadales bacterium]|nr:1-(5-phosphoribosyl)-5-[(5-phosphoribosylamino)methylideneamino] imidazole-4-carboxamide isomerase [Gemmatimonadales bacterium]
MELYPAVDIQGGRVARSVAGESPVLLAQRFARDGARWIHVVDLDRAFGTGDNDELVRRVLAATEVPIQVSGGLAREAEIAERIGWGARRVVIGSGAAVDAGLVGRLVARHGAERFAIGIDTRDGRLAPRGGRSSVLLDLSPLELAGRVQAAGVRTVIYTDAARDGTLAGPDVAGARALAGSGMGLDVVVSGGVGSLEDVRRIRDAGLAGAIVGRALHERRFTLTEALACLA